MYIKYNQIPVIRELPEEQQKVFIKELKAEKKIDLILIIPIAAVFIIMVESGIFDMKAAGLIWTTLFGALVGAIVATPIQLILLNTVIPNWAHAKVNKN